MKQYVLSVCALSLLCSLWHALTPEGAGKMRVRHLGALILVLAMLSPLASLEGSSIRQFAGAYEAETTRWQQEAERQQRQALEAGITSRCAAYILKQTQRLGAPPLEARFTFRMEQGLPVPDGVTLDGPCTPQNQRILQSILHRELGIPPERQVWNCS